MDYGVLDLAAAYNNNGQYEKAVSVAEDCLANSADMSDTLLIKELNALLGTSKFVLEDYQGSLLNYYEVCRLDSCALTEDNKRNISFAVSRIDMDSVPDRIRRFAESIIVSDDSNQKFVLLAECGDFEKAYEDLVRYKNRQDSVLALILRNDVSESVLGYEDMQNRLRQARLRTVRTLSVLVVALIAVIVLAVLFWYRSRLLKKTMEFDRMEAKMKSLRSDLSSYMERFSVLSEKNSEMADTLYGAVRDRYSRVDRLCDKYYQNSARTESVTLTENERRKRKEMHKEVEDIIKDFSDEDFLMEVEEYVDRYLDGIWTSFKEDFPTVTGDGRRLFLYIVLGFSVRTLSVIFDVEKDVVYNRRSRLRSKIAASSSPRKERYLAVL